AANRQTLLLDDRDIAAVFTRENGDRVAIARGPHRLGKGAALPALAHHDRVGRNAERAPTSDEGQQNRGAGEADAQPNSGNALRRNQLPPILALGPPVVA